MSGDDKSSDIELGTYDKHSPTSSSRGSSPILTTSSSGSSLTSNDLSIPLLQTNDKDNDSNSNSSDDSSDSTELNCLTKTKKRLEDAYGVFAESNVGLVVRAFLKSVPQCLILSGAASYATAGLITPLVFEEASNDNQIRNYFFYYAIIDALILLSTLAYDTNKRLKNYNNPQEHYDSFGIFRLRATFMGAAVGGILTSDFMDLVAPKANPWLTFFITLPATLFPTYLRFHYFKHDIKPTPLKTEASNEQETPIEETRDASKPGVFNNPLFNSVAAGFSAMGAALLMYRVIRAIPNHEHKEFTTAKILCTVLPFVFGSAATALKKALPSFHYRWKQLEIMSGDSAMINLSVGNFFISLNFYNNPSYLTQQTRYFIFAASIFLAYIQATRFIKRSSNNTAQKLTTDYKQPAV